MMKSYDKIVQGLRDAIEYEKGNLGARTVKIFILPLKNYTNVEIINLREKHGLTQTAFAYVLGVKPKTVKAWESGRNKPNGSAKRLLQFIEQNPDLLNQIYNKQDSFNLKEN